MRPIVDFTEQNGPIMNKNINCSQRNKLSPGIFGTPTETTVSIEGKSVKSLLDTGSTVSTLSQSYYDNNLQHLKLQQLDSILKTECAGGQMLPYNGFIEVTIYLKDLDRSFNCIILIIPDTPYHETVPLLIGTNILNSIMESCRQTNGERFLQTSNLTTPWYSSFKCILLREKELSHNNYKLAVVKFAGNTNVIIPPNTNITLQGYLDKKLPYSDISVMVQPTKNSIIPSDLDITPSLLDYTYHQNGAIPVQVSNVTTQTVNISPHALLCEIQPVSI